MIFIVISKMLKYIKGKKYMYKNKETKEKMLIFLRKKEEGNNVNYFLIY